MLRKKEPFLQRASRRFKFSAATVTFTVTLALIAGYFTQEAQAADEITWNGETWSALLVSTFDRGRVVHFSKNTAGAVCHRWGILFPGVSLLPSGVLAVFYALALIYCFMGIGVVSDIFMDSIGIITS